MTTMATPVPSGSQVLLDLTESFSFTNGSRLVLPPVVRSLTLYGFPAGAPTLTLRSDLAVAPSRFFSPSTLQLGVIDLAVRMPDAAGARGTVIGPTGGKALASSGERVDVPAGAAADELPVLLTRIDKSDFPLPIPAGATYVGGVTFDLHGGVLAGPATFAIPVPTGVTSTSQVLVGEIVEVDGTSAIALVATATLRGNELVTTTDPLGDGSVQLPGIRDEGRYAFLNAAQPLGFLTGVVTGTDGAPLSGAAISTTGLGIVSVTDATGRYVLAGPIGDQQVRATRLDTHDTNATSVRIVTMNALVTAPIAIGSQPPAVVSVTPGNGTGDVPLVSSVRIGFSQLIDPGSVTRDNVVVMSGGQRLTGTVSVPPGNMAVTFRPDALLASDTTYQLTVSDVRDLVGRPMTAAFVSQFRTVDLTPPPAPVAGSLSATIPDASGNSIVAGTQGTADPGGLVLVKNLRTGAITTLTPNADGSFSGSVASVVTDRLQLTLKDAVGNSTSVALGAFRNADGSVVVGSEGGRIEGPAGTFIDVPAGALDDGTVVKIEPVALDALPLPPPGEYPFTGALRLDLGGAVSRTSLHIGVPAPADATADEQVLVGSPLQLKDRTTWTLVDRAHLANGRYTTESPPFPSVVGGGVFGFFRPATGTCISFINVIVDFGDSLLVEAFDDPFSFFSDVQSIVLAKRCESAINIQVKDPDTAAVIRQIDARAPSTNGQIDKLPDSLTDDQTAPLVTALNTFNGQQVDHLEVQFSEPMDAPRVKNDFHVEDSHGTLVSGTVELASSNTFATFRPATPFRLGEQYLIKFDGMTDRAGNALVLDPAKFTPFDPNTTDPFPVNRLSTVPGLGDALQKCANGSCNTSVRDNVIIGNVQFLANGLANAQERYQLFPPQRVIAVDVSDVTTPRQIGFSGLPEDVPGLGGLGSVNPRVLGTVENVLRVTEPNGRPFKGNLLLVASGGRILDDIELPSKIELYDVTSCTPDSATNCLLRSPSPDPWPRKGIRFLSTPLGEAPRRGVPLEAGVPNQIAVLHQPGTTDQQGNTADDTIAAYVTVSGVGLEAVDVAHAFNAEQLEDPAVTLSVPLGPDGFVRGDFLDVAVVKNQVAAIELDAVSGTFKLDLFSAQLTDKRSIVLPGPAARVAIFENMLVDVDRDGRVGSAEDNDGNDGISSRDELFDLALVSSGPLSSCPANTPSPCGEIDVIDLSALTDLSHASGRGVITRIPMPGPAFSIKVDQDAAVAYVEVRGAGLVILDLTNIVKAIQDGVSPEGLRDTNGDGIDDRVLDVIDKHDIFNGRINVDTARGVAFVNGSVTGLTTIEVANRCTDLTADFGPDNQDNTSRAARTGHKDDAKKLKDEKEALLDLLDRAANALGDAGITDIAMLEQGSGACFWRAGDLVNNCSAAFTQGLSDHDVEVLVPQGQVAQAQDTLDTFMGAETKHDPVSEVSKIVSLFGFSKDAFEAAELLNGTPQNKTGDPTGDLAMGRQLLLLLWTLDGEYVTGFEGKVSVGQVLERLKAIPRGPSNPIIPGEPSGIPRLEGYEWSLLQELNFYKTGAMLRILGGCTTTSATSGIVDATGAFNEINDRDVNFGEPSLLSQDCQDQLHSVAKAGIRSVMAMLAANDSTNPTILEIDRESFARDGCLTGVVNPREPPATPDGYTPKPCSGFEEYIASVAITSVRDNLGVFTADQLPQIFTLFCAKVGENCPGVGGPLFTTDREANQFIADTIQLIRDVQLNAEQVYDDTVALDTQLIGQIPFLLDVAEACHKNGVDGVTETSPRSLLRECNKAIVKHKLDGDPTLTIAPPPQPVEMITPQRSKDLQKLFGVKNLVLKDLRVRLSNSDARALTDTVVRLSVGDGTDQTHYRTLQDVVVPNIAAGSHQVLAVDQVDGKDQARFPVAFTLPNLAEGVPQAISFFLDPARRVPEASKEDNQAAFFFYRLNTAEPGGPQISGKPVSAIRNVTPDPLCRPRPAFNLTLNLRDLNNPPDIEAPQLTVLVGQEVELRYHADNPGRDPLRQLTVRRTGNPNTVLGPMDLAPATPSFTGVQQVEQFRPDGTGPFHITATGFAVDSHGNTVRAESREVILMVTPARCPTLITTLKPDPNPFDKDTGLPVSTIMKGGSLYRHYRLFDGTTGQPVPNATIRVTARQLPAGAIADLDSVSTDSDGYLIHQPTDAADDPRGMRIAADVLGTPNQQFEVTIKPDGAPAGSSCGQQFTVNITERQFTRALGTGADLKLAAKKILGPLGVEGNEGLGFTLSQTATDSGGQDLTFSRKSSSTAELKVGGDPRDALHGFLQVELFTQDGKMIEVEAGGVGSGSLSAGASLSVQLMTQDAHNFQIPLDTNSSIQAGLLVEGQLMTAAFGVTPIPGMKLFGLALNELAEQMTRLLPGTSLVAKRTSAGGSIGGAFEANASGESKKIVISGTGTFLDGRSVEFSFDGGGALTMTGRLSYAPMKQELTSTFTMKAALEGSAGFVTAFGTGIAQAVRQTTDADDVVVPEFGKTVDELLKGRLSGHGNATQTFSIVWDTSGGFTVPPMKRIVVSLEDDKTWGITEGMLEGDDVDANPGVSKSSTYTISDPLKFDSAIETLALIQLLQGGAHLLPGFPTAGEEMTKLLALADTYEVEVEHGVGGEFALNPGKLLKSDKLDVGLEFKYDESVTHNAEVGSIRRGAKFRIATYPDNYPSPDVLIGTLASCFGVEKEAVAAYQKVSSVIAKGVGAVKTLVSVFFPEPSSTLPPADGPGGPFDAGGVEQAPGGSGAGVELLVDGAAEPNADQPLGVDLIAFPYRTQQTFTTPRVPSPLDVGGASNVPHHGVGGFFQFAPDGQPLAAPAQLTIHYLDTEVAGLDERTLAIYFWNNSRADWDRVGGTVDTANHTVTASVTRLGMYTAALPMPAGPIVLTAQSQTVGTGQDAKTTVTYTSDVIRLNTGGIVPDGTLFSVQTTNPASNGLAPFGTVTSSDEDPVTDWIQVSSHGGVIHFIADLPGAAGQARVVVISVVGTALANQVVAYP